MSAPAKVTALDQSAVRGGFRFGASEAICLVLMLIAALRTLHHAMWRDELQIFQIAANSPSFSDLISNLRYEPHPALWYLLVWVFTFITTDPIGMQILHIALAIAVWLIIYRWSPFRVSEMVWLFL